MGKKKQGEPSTGSKITVEIPHEETLNIDGDGDQYGTFFESIRVTLAQGPLVQGVPTLAPQVPKTGNRNFQLLKVVLKYNYWEDTGKILLMFRIDNLYLLGYGVLDEHGSETWYELNHGEDVPPIIKQFHSTTTNLGLDDTYGALAGVAKRSLRDTLFSHYHIYMAATSLAMPGQSAKKEHVQDVARAIMTFAVSISEATRFKRIVTFIREGWAEEKGTPLGETNDELIKSWEDLSKAVKAYDADKGKSDFKKVGAITDLKSAIDVLGIMLDTTKKN